MMAQMSSDLKTGLSSVETKLATTQASVDATASSILTLNTWKSGIDAQVLDLSASVGELRKQVDRVVIGVGLSALGEPPSIIPGAAKPPAIPAATDAGKSLQEQDSGQFDHGIQHIHRGLTGGQLVLSSSTPVAGTDHSQSALPFVPITESQSVAIVPRVVPLPPQTEFPRFDGENPRLWQKAAEKYFLLFSVDHSQRVEYATMHFTGLAAMWLQGVEDQLDNCTWEVLCDKLSKQFDRGQYQMLYRHVFKLKQTSSVAEYVEKFNALRHHMIAYKPDLDPTFFVTRFIDDLARDIRVVVMIQRPNDLDTAVSLALLQEEIEEDVPKFSHKQIQARPPFRPPIQQPGKAGNSSAEERMGSVANKVSALKTFRKARGLCFTCGEKWAPGHKCSTTVQLHVVEELLAMLNASDSDTETYEDVVADAQEVLMSISKQAVNGVEAPKSVRLLGRIQGHDVIILIDSGSSNNFISSQLASQLTGVQQLDKPVSVRVAGGGKLTGTAEIPNCSWTCQGNTFCTNLKVLPLQRYDVILGMQWLEQLGLVTTHWAEKWFEFEWLDKQCKLQGTRCNIERCEAISVEELQELNQQDSIYYMVQVYAAIQDTEQEKVPQIVAMVLGTLVLNPIGTSDSLFDHFSVAFRDASHWPEHLATGDRMHVSATCSVRVLLWVGFVTYAPFLNLEKFLVSVMMPWSTAEGKALVSCYLTNHGHSEVVNWYIESSTWLVFRVYTPRNLASTSFGMLRASPPGLEERQPSAIFLA